MKCLLHRSTDFWSEQEIIPSASSPVEESNYIHRGLKQLKHVQGSGNQFQPRINLTVKKKKSPWSWVLICFLKISTTGLSSLETTLTHTYPLPSESLSVFLNSCPTPPKIFLQEKHSLLLQSFLIFHGFQTLNNPKSHALDCYREQNTGLQDRILLQAMQSRIASLGRPLIFYALFKSSLPVHIKFIIKVS